MYFHAPHAPINWLTFSSLCRLTFSSLCMLTSHVIIYLFVKQLSLAGWIPHTNLQELGLICLACSSTLSLTIGLIEEWSRPRCDLEDGMPRHQLAQHIVVIFFVLLKKKIFCDFYFMFEVWTFNFIVVVVSIDVN